METLHDSVDIIKRYFPALTDSQMEAYRRLEELYTDWNSKINVISRADTGNLYTRHVLHSLAIAAFLGTRSGCFATLSSLRVAGPGLPGGFSCLAPPPLAPGLPSPGPSFSACVPAVLS